MGILAKIIVSLALVMMTAVCATASDTDWRIQTWDFDRVSAADITEGAFVAPANHYTADEFADFFAVFSNDPAFQIANTRWPLQVLRLDPADEGIHVQETIYFAKPDTTDGPRLFPSQIEMAAAGLEYYTNLPDGSQPPQASVVLREPNAEYMDAVYVFKWDNGWYLHEIVDLIP